MDILKSPSKSFKQRSKSSLHLNDLAARIHDFDPFSTEKCKHTAVFNHASFPSVNHFKPYLSSKPIFTTNDHNSGHSEFLHNGEQLNETKTNTNRLSSAAQFNYHVLETTKSKANDLFKKRDNKKLAWTSSNISNDVDLEFSSSSLASFIKNVREKTKINGNLMFNSSYKVSLWGGGLIIGYLFGILTIVVEPKMQHGFTLINN